MWITRIALLLALVSTGCTGAISDVGGGFPDEPQITAPPPAAGAPIAPSGMRRLTVAEFDQTVQDLLFLDDVSSVLLLPEDQLNPFDNDASTQTVSQALVEGTELLISDQWDVLSADQEAIDRIVTCTPSGSSDRECMEAFVTSFGRRALRRPVTEAEVDALVDGPAGEDGALAIAEASDDFYAGVGFVVKVLLLDPEFLFRIEVGEPAGNGIYKLGAFELASRLSYLLWGSLPDDELFDRAAAGGLATSDDLHEEAMRMLGDSRAIDRIARFHGLWLGYEQNVVPGNDITDGMLAESRSLVERVLFTEARPWRDLFTFEETFLTEPLATHYGLPAPDSDSGWVVYPSSERRGILSHGSFLALGQAFGDTSPVQRGRAIKERLFCQPIASPPPTVNIDERPESEAGFCKTDRYAAHSTGGCAGCHAQMDPVGFGLENYDLAGRFRTHEPDNPMTDDDESTCEVSGDGELVGVGEFTGPAELGALGVDSGLIQACLTQQLYRFASGRFNLGVDDRQIVSQLQASAGNDFSMEQILIGLVTDEWFRYRREPALPTGEGR